MGQLLPSCAVAIAAAIVLGYLIRFAVETPGFDYAGCAILLGVGWIVALQSSSGYDIRHLAVGPTEAKAVLRGSAIAVSVLAVFCYATRPRSPADS